MNALWALFVGIALIVGGILVTQVAWNISIAPIFGLPEISFIQAIGILFFALLIRPGSNKVAD